MPRTLFCTVGGSPDPILRAIKDNRPDRIVFVCSEDDETLGRRGSTTQVEGQGFVCRSSTAAAKPDRPAIPTQAGLTREQWDVLLVPADNPEEALKRLLPRLASAQISGEVTADYTGGTKSMSAALFLAAVLTPEVQVSLVTGPRADLRQVVPSLERTRAIGTGVIRDRQLSLLVANAWSRFAWGEASHLLEPYRGEDPGLLRLTALTRVYQLWDAFDHAAALGLAERVGRFMDPKHLAALRMLAGPASERAEAAFVWDLWLAAERRLHAGSWDAAVLELYRVLEWTAQWCLRWRGRVDASDVDLGALPELADLVAPAFDGRKVLAMHAAWLAIARLDLPLAEVARTTEGWRQAVGTLRNQSILAHGRTPIPADRAREFQAGMKERVLPDFIAIAFGGREPWPQLPSDPQGVLGR